MSVLSLDPDVQRCYRNKTEKRVITYFTLMLQYYIDNVTFGSITFGSVTFGSITFGSIKLYCQSNS